MTVEESIKYLNEYLYCNFECNSDYMDCKDCGITYSDADFQKALQMIKEAAEKQVPKKTIWKSKMNWNNIVGYYCPNCFAPILDDYSFYCKNCGQKLDWSKEK